MTDRFRPDAAVRRVVPQLSGKRAHSVVIDDPHCAPGGVTREERAAALKRFLDFAPSFHRVLMGLPPSPATFASETNKDRSGKHGSEVA